MFAARMEQKGGNKRVSLERLKRTLREQLPAGHVYLLVVVDPKSRETRFTAPDLSRPLSVHVLEAVLAELKATRLPARSIHHKIPVITK